MKNIVIIGIIILIVGEFFTVMRTFLRPSESAIEMSYLSDYVNDSQTCPMENYGNVSKNGWTGAFSGI